MEIKELKLKTNTIQQINFQNWEKEKFKKENNNTQNSTKKKFHR